MRGNGSNGETEKRAQFVTVHHTTLPEQNSTPEQGVS
jgi:hypothetical protein